jgi:hypothetical protein
MAPGANREQVPPDDVALPIGRVMQFCRLRPLTPTASPARTRMSDPFECRRLKQAIVSRLILGVSHQAKHISLR